MNFSTMINKKKGFQYSLRFSKAVICKKVVLSVLLAVFFAPEIFGQAKKSDGPSFKDKYLYSFEIGFSTGFHMFPDSPAWVDNRVRSINEDLFFRNQSDFYSRGFDLPGSSARSLNSVFSLEGSLGVRVYNVPGLKNAAFFKKLNGIRLRGGFDFYPFAGRNIMDKKTILTYTTPDAPAPALVNKSYNGNVKVEESLLIIVPNGGMYYYHETGLFRSSGFFRKHALIPYFGVDLGIVIANGMRKYTIDGGPLTITADTGSGPVTREYTIRGELQEHFVNDVGFRVSPAFGATLQLSGPHFVYLRMGYHIQLLKAQLVRRGGFTETATSGGAFSYTYSEAIREEKRDVGFNQMGFYLLLGYSVALL